MAKILSFADARRQRLGAAVDRRLNFACMLIDCESPDPLLLARFTAAPCAGSRPSLDITVELGTSADLQAIRLPWGSAWRLDAVHAPAHRELSRLARRSITHARWRSGMQAVAWQDLPNIRSPVLNAILWLLLKLEDLRIPVQLSRDLEVSTEVCHALDTPAASQLVLSLR